MAIDAKTKLGKAKAALILEQPFHASILCNLPMVERQDIPTMATDGRTFYYSPDFVDKMSLDETKFVLCHEVMHCVFAHMFRKGQRDHRRWNQAGDYIINQLLVDEKIGSMPEGGLLNQALVQAGGNTTEGVYELLPEDKGDGSGNGHGDPLDDVIDAGGSMSQADQAAAEADMKVMVAQAAQAAKMCGKLSAGMERFVNLALKPKVDWRDVLRRFVTAKAKIDHSFAKPKRRFLDEDIYLPSLTGNSLGKITVAVDTSGSIGEQELAEFAAEILAIQQDTRPVELHVVYFDSEVVHHDKFEQDDDVRISPHGGGGTAFSPIFRFIEAQDIDPVATVVLTDLCCSDFGPPPAYPVMWVTTYSTEAPWGEVVEMKPRA